MADPTKKPVIDKFVLLLQSVLDARARALVQFNVPADKLDIVLGGLPSMRAPSVTKLTGDTGYSVSTAVPTGDIPELVPVLKAHGATDILVMSIQQLVA
jgi:ATP phosphoribosyltransferase-like protein